MNNLDLPCRSLTTLKKAIRVREQNPVIQEEIKRALLCIPTGEKKAANKSQVSSTGEGKEQCKLKRNTDAWTKWVQTEQKFRLIKRYLITMKRLNTWNILPGTLP